MEVVRVEGLPEPPLAAAAEFYARWLPAIPRDADLLIAFLPAVHSDRAWRLAAVQELARAAAPRRVNGVAADSETAIASALAYLGTAPGVTGQYWPLDATGAEGA
jgi:hypothetical protein